MKQFFRLTAFLTLFSFLLISCEKETNNPPAKPPVAIAGNTQTVQLPISTATLTGSGTSANGSIVGYLWSLVSGPNVPVITSPSSATTTIKELIAGTYVFQFAVIDTVGLTGVDTVSIIVNPSLHKTLTLQPTNNLFEGHVDSYSPNAPLTNGDSQFDITAWTANDAPENQRSFLKIDFSEVPSTAVIDSAILYLYATPAPHGGNNTDANFGTANAGIIQRITSPWSTNTPYTWNTQPTLTSANQVAIPQSTSSTSNSVIFVTSLITDMLQFGNNGFAMKLQNEQTYNIRQFASSYNTNASTHPKLVIWYH